MYRIDNSSAVPVMPAPGPPGTPGFFTDGNPAAALEATIVDAWWANIIQEEILTVIQAAGFAPNKASHTQLYEALNMLYAGNVPVTGFLPITGGTIYRANTSDPLRIYADPTHWARTLYESGTARRWSVGCAPDGEFQIGDEFLSLMRFRIATDGGATIPGNTHIQSSLSIGGGLTFAGGAWIDGLHAALGNVAIGGNASVGGNLSVGGGLTFAGGAWIDGLHASLGDVAIGGNASVGGILTIGGQITFEVSNAWLDANTGYLAFRDGIFSNDLVVSHYLQVGNSVSIDGPLTFTAGAWIDGVNASLGNVLVTGNLTVAGTIINPPSDRRLKRDIRDYCCGLDAILRLNPVIFQFNGRGGMPADGRDHIGLVADDVAGVMPEMVGSHRRRLDPEDAEETDILTLDPTVLPLALANAVKELARRVEVLERRE